MRGESPPGPGQSPGPAPSPGGAGRSDAGPADAVRRATDLTGVLTLKHDTMFLLTDAFGDVHVDSRGLGLYEGDTRFLSRYEFRLNGERPVILRASSGGSFTGTLQLTNPDYLRDLQGKRDPEVVLDRQSLGILRERVIAAGFRERVTVTNYLTRSERCELTIHVESDFADIFEVRGQQRTERGRMLRPEVDRLGMRLGYRGLDGWGRQASVRFSEPPRFAIEDGLATWAWTLEPGESRTLEITVTCAVHEDGTSAAEAAAAWGHDQQSPPMLEPDTAAAAHRAWTTSSAAVSTGDPFVDRALHRALADLRMLVNQGPGADERYLAAGVPWFCCLFGRDSLITAFQLLSIRPQVGAETLRLLARLQATEVDEWRDAEPGKILHELRTGELARTGDVPHTPYYGSVDATPLWLMLLGAYHRWTADDALVDALWPNALAALEWLDRWADRDGDGFVEYERRSPGGLPNQGWKDSVDSIRYRDGSLAVAPLALIEVQGYVYAARRELARLALLRGDDRLAAEQERESERIRGAVEERYWMPDAGTYAIALDGRGRQVDAVSSNPGHALWAGLPSPERAGRVVASLMSPQMWSGWGIRTLSAEMPGYNPISYHVGSIWPHDNAIAAAGLARYGYLQDASRISGAMLQATAYFRDARLPELFCGFARDRSPYPVAYPIACQPQAWAAGSLFQLLESTLGLHPDALGRELELRSPSLPDWLPHLRIDNLRVGASVLDLRFARTDGSTSVEVLRRTGDVSVVLRV